MEIWTLAWDTDNGTGASVHMTERECFEELIRDYVETENREEALKELELDGTTDEAGEHDFFEWFAENVRETLDTFSIESHKIDTSINVFDDRELATVLYALRALQADRVKHPSYVDAEMFSSPLFEDISDFEPLDTPALIDGLCERLNLGPEEPPKRKVLIQVKDGVAEVMECPEDVDVTIDDLDSQEDLAGLEEPSRDPNVETADGYKEERAEWEKARAGLIPHDPQDDEPDDDICSACQKQHGVCPQTAGSSDCAAQSITLSPLEVVLLAENAGVDL